MTAAAFAAWWQALPVRARLIAALDDADDHGCVEAVQMLFADPCWVWELVQRMIEAARGDAGFLPPFAAVHGSGRGGLQLVDHPSVTIGIGWIPAGTGDPAAPLLFTGQRMLVRTLVGGGARIGLWHAVERDGDGVVRCAPAGTRRLPEMLELDSRREAFAILEAERPLLVLHATITKGRAELASEHDRATGMRIGTAATDPAASQAQMLATLAAALRHPEAPAALEKLCDHPAFFVRWHAARELTALDLRAARPRLSDLAVSDPHRQVRAAAAGALRLVDARCPA